MKASEVRIAVIGAGMGGLACAAALRKFGFEVRVFEQAKEFRRIGAGIQVTPNAVKALRGLGLEAQIRERGFEASFGYNRDSATGAITNTLELGSAIIDRCGAPLVTMHRGDLHAALLSAVPDGVIELGKKVRHYSQDDRQVQLFFEQGAPETFDLLIAADGVHSVVREQIHGKEAPRFTGRVAYRTTFPASLLGDLQIDERCKWWGPDRHIVIYYTTRRRDEVYFVTSTPEPDFSVESWSTKGNLDELRSAYKDFYPTVRGVLDACPEVHKWALVSRDPLPSWIEGRVALLGDAAHPMTPYMAQGAASAIEDAVVLARCLQAASSDALANALSLYEAVRKPRATAIQQTSALNSWMKTETDFDWVYGHDVWQTPLDQE